MKITRIEIEGTAGHVAIARETGSPTIRIDSILHDPKGQQAWVTWEIPARTDDDELFRIAQVVQRRCDGVRGTNSMIHDYFNELLRLAD